MSLVLGICDRVYVIEFGKEIAHGKPEEVRNNPRVISAYLGSTSMKEISDDLAAARSGISSDGRDGSGVALGQGQARS